MSSLFSSLRGWLTSLLQSLGFASKSATVILLGLDNAGKTTLQHRLKSGQLQQFMPTQRAKEETMQIEGLTIRAWDLGGQAHTEQHRACLQGEALSRRTCFAHDFPCVLLFALLGHAAARQLWVKYAAMADGLIFMVDAAEPSRLAEAATELKALLQAVAQAQVPVAVLANKSDIPVLGHGGTQGTRAQGARRRQQS